MPEVGAAGKQSGGAVRTRQLFPELSPMLGPPGGMANQGEKKKIRNEIESLNPGIARKCKKDGFPKGAVVSVALLGVGRLES